MSLFEATIDDTDLTVAGNSARFGGRWRFAGAGLSNVWRYGDLELPAHSGRLLLRGPNGTGKTTALEALWPYLLDLNARKMSAGKARTTSLTSLMRDGADGKLRVGYMWMTYAAPDTNDLVSYGVRITYSSGSASTKAVPFFLPGRPLHELALYENRRATLPLEAFSAAVVAADGIVFASDDDYIRDLATRVFHSEPAELEMLATRIRAVRDPTLLGEVSPAQAATALRASLPGVDAQVVNDTADALAESDTTRQAFERDRDAAAKLDDFARAWAGHVVDVAATAVTRTIDAQDNLRELIARRDRHGASHERALAELDAAEATLGELSDDAAAKRAEVDTLKSSDLFIKGRELTELKNTAHAQAGTAEAEFEALRQGADRLTSNGRSLRDQLGELADETRSVVDQARSTDPAATGDGLAITWDDQARPTRNVAGVPVAVGAGIALHADIEALAAASTSWEQLAGTHRARAHSAKLAVGEHAAKVAPLSAKTLDAARHADELRRSADNRAGEARTAAHTAAACAETLVAAVVDWSTAAGPLAGAVDAEFAEVVADEPAQILAAVDETRIAATGVANELVLAHELRAARFESDATALESAAHDSRAQAAELRAGRLLALPRPSWAGAGNDDDALGSALEWNDDVTEQQQSLIEAALAASGALAAAVQLDSRAAVASTAVWTVNAHGPDVHPNLTAVVHVDPSHRTHDAVTGILTKIALHPTADAADDTVGLVIGADGTFRAGVLHGDTTGAEQTSDRFVGQRQRREAALRQAQRLQDAADTHDADARTCRAGATSERAAGAGVAATLGAYPGVEELRTCESRRSLAVEAAHRALEEFNTAHDHAQTLAEQLADEQRAWAEMVAAMGLPSGLEEIVAIRDSGNRIAAELTGAAKHLGVTLAGRLLRLVDDVARDHDAAVALADLELAAARSQATWSATNEQLRTIEVNVGASILDIETRYRAATVELDDLDKAVEVARRRQTDAVAAASGLEGQLQAAGLAAEAARPAAGVTRDALRSLLAVPGVTDIVFDTDQAAIGDDELAGVVGAAISGRATNAKRTVREREEAARAALSGIWSIDPGDDHPELESYVLTHRDITYTPPSAHRHAADLAARAEAALKQADANALQEFVIGKLPKAISRGWETMHDWRREVNAKMRNARASSGVSVQVKLTVRSDLSAHARTVHELLCKTADGQRLPAAREQVSVALQALIAGAEGDDMHERVGNAVNLADWVDVSYEVTREGQAPTVWGSRTGLSGGERRLVVLAPMLAAVAAAYDRISSRGLRLAALDEVPAEVDERGREGLARYIAELDLDLVCTSYLWDGAPGAWDGVDAHDLEAERARHRRGVPDAGARPHPTARGPVRLSATPPHPRNVVTVVCDWCGVDCSDVDVDALLGAELSWVWEQLGAVADRRGEVELTSGTVAFTAPHDAGMRAAGAGLLPGRFAPGQTRRVDLGDVSAALRRIDERLTPGIVTAHALKRRLAPRAAARAARGEVEADLIAHLAPISNDDAAVQAAWSALRRSGRVTQLVADPNARAVLDHVARVVVRLQGRDDVSVDRRVLAHEVTGDPHALDDDQPLASMVTAVLASLGLVDQGSRSRATWAQVGVHFDAITAGLSMVGIAPAGWTVPAGSPVTIPPHVLADCDWPRPPGGNDRLFVSENPSVLTAVLGVAGPAMICTSGKPSSLVVETLAALDAAGWRLFVRADFDDSGVSSVNTILAACPGAVAWRMGVDDYRAAVAARSARVLRPALLPVASWDAALKPAMLATGFAAFEEATIAALVRDVSDLVPANPPGT